jgi:hypothetical protein
MSTPIALYCKSYRTDLKRVIRLADSIAKFNVDSIPFYLSVPGADLALFREHLTNQSINIIDDDLIVSHNSSIDKHKLHSLPGSISQQIVKSEFWRLGISDTYLCLDSDAVFIRPFSRNDFLWKDNIPYTVIDESREFLAAALQTGKQRILTVFHNEAERVQRLFDRPGKAYAFGPFPLLWHRSVWKSLEEQYLRPRSMNLLDAIVSAPMESRWYGEALLSYRAIQLIPCQPLFKVYHYAWQFDRDRRAKINNDQLAQLYCGAIYQSAWEREMDWPAEGGKLSSRIGRRLRRGLGRI